MRVFIDQILVIVKPTDFVEAPTAVFPRSARGFCLNGTFFGDSIFQKAYTTMAKMFRYTKYKFIVVLIGRGKWPFNNVFVPPLHVL